MGFLQLWVSNFYKIVLVQKYWVFFDSNSFKFSFVFNIIIDIRYDSIWLFLSSLFSLFIIFILIVHSRNDMADELKR